MDAGDAIRCGGEIVAEGRMETLALAQHLLVDQRRLAEFLEPARQGLHAIDSLVER